MSNQLVNRILSSIILLPLSIFIIYEGALFFNFFIILCCIIAIYEWYKMIRNKIYKIFGYIFLFFSFYCFYSIRNNFFGEYIYTYFILLVCISTDIGGYVFGKLFKGPKLTKISPNKTYSGSIGSYILSFISSFVFIKYLETIYNIHYSFEIILFVLIISSTSQLGDILISYFKRMSKIKDTGNIIPGHGGILDRIDGIIIAIPLCYILLSLNFFNFIK